MQFCSESVDCQVSKLQVLSDYELFSQAGITKKKKVSNMGTAQMESNCSDIQKSSIVIYIQMNR